jgi:hypothetical protein
MLEFLPAAPFLEQAAAEFAATDRPPYLFDLGPAVGRKAVDGVQSDEIAKPAVEQNYAVAPWAATDGASRRLDASEITGAGFDAASCHQLAEGHFLRRDAMQWFWDQGEACADKLRQVGVRVTATRYQGITPGLVMLNVLRSANAAEADANHAIGYLSMSLESRDANANPAVSRRK